MESIKVTLVWTKETKNTHRYDAPEGRDGLIPALYVPKAATGPQAPAAIVVTVESAG